MATRIDITTQEPQRAGTIGLPEGARINNYHLQSGTRIITGMPARVGTMWVRVRVDPLGTQTHCIRTRGPGLGIIVV